MAGDLVQRLGVVVVLGVDAVLVLGLGAGDTAKRAVVAAQLGAAGGIIGDCLGNNILCSLQCFLRSLYFFFFGNILGCLVKHRFCCLLVQNVFCQRLQSLLLCNAGAGLSLGTIGAVQILYHYQSLGCQNLLL